MGLEEQKAFPFIYTFVNRNDDTWSPNQALPMSNLSCLGPVVPALSSITHNVPLDPDYNYKLIAIKFSAYKYIGPNGASGHYAWNAQWGFGPAHDGGDTSIDFAGTPLVSYVKMTLSFQGSGNSVIQHGGPDTGPLGGQRVPLPIDVKQGYDSGYYVARTPHLLPRQGMMVFEITNDFDVDIVVAAAIYGLKIRL
jgi:hypothetical protein